MPVRNFLLLKFFVLQVHIPVGIIPNQQHWPNFNGVLYHIHDLFLVTCVIIFSSTLRESPPKRQNIDHVNIFRVKFMVFGEYNVWFKPITITKIKTYHSQISHGSLQAAGYGSDKVMPELNFGERRKDDVTICDNELPSNNTILCIEVGMDKHDVKYNDSKS